MVLKQYKAKRNFKITPEPLGTKNKKTDVKLLYVIQKHHASHLHYDFRLEMSGVLLSWAVPKRPSTNPAIKRLAIHVEDHPLEYGSFEGTIPKGEYGAGSVEIWDEGHWICLDSDPKKAYKSGNLTFILNGKKLTGIWKLIQLKTNNPKNWILFKTKKQD